MCHLRKWGIRDRGQLLKRGEREGDRAIIEKGYNYYEPKRAEFPIANETTRKRRSWDLERYLLALTQGEKKRESKCELKKGSSLRRPVLKNEKKRKERGYLEHQNRVVVRDADQSKAEVTLGGEIVCTTALKKPLYTEPKKDQ